MSGVNFLESRLGEVPRITLPRNRVNKGPRELSVLLFWLERSWSLNRHLTCSSVRTSSLSASYSTFISCVAHNREGGRLRRLLGALGRGLHSTGRSVGRLSASDNLKDVLHV